MSLHAAQTEWTVDEALKYAEDPHSVTRASERVLALEVRKLRKEAIDLQQALWDWQSRALKAESPAEVPAPPPPRRSGRNTVHDALGIPPEHAAFARREWGDGE